MEDILKFVTTEQSRRSEAFMFIWRILMAVLLTNNKMNELGYHFINKDIGLHTAIEFLFSTAFFYASFWYLIFIFLFFWGLKVLISIEIIILGSFNVRLSEDYLLHVFRFWGMFTKFKGEWYLKDREAFEGLKAICHELNNSHTSAKENIYTYMNLVISTYYWYKTLESKVVFPYNVDVIILVVVIFCIIQVLGFFWLMTTGDEFNNMLIKYRKKGFFNELNV